MILVGYSWGDLLIGILWVSLILLVIIIGYRWLLRRLSRNELTGKSFCVLYNLEIEPASGELPFYFTAPEKMNYELLILDLDMNKVVEVANQECNIEGNIVRYDSTKLKNGEYFYCLKTENQKVVKKMTILN